MTFVKPIHNEQRAKESVTHTKEQLNYIEEQLKSDKSLSKQEAQDLFNQYQQLPITYQINWSCAGEDPKENQKIADFCRDKLNELNCEYRFTQSKIPRAFNADNY